MLDDIQVLCHSSIKLNKEKVIYFDPFHIKEEFHDADIIFCTHSHYDHFSKEDINKVKKEDTFIVVTEDLKNKCLENGFSLDQILLVKPNREYKLFNFTFNTIPAYNINKQFHPKQNNWVGYILNFNNTTFYIAGDTDITEENKKVKCDIAFIPVGGTYTMDYKEAAELTNIINPKIVIPTHYGDIVGKKEDAQAFEQVVNSNIQCVIKMN